MEEPIQSRDVYILQERCIGQRAEFDWGEVNLAIGGYGRNTFLPYLSCHSHSIDLREFSHEKVGKSCYEPI